MLGRVDLVGTDVWEELSASIIREIRIGEIGTTLAVTSNRRTLCFGVLFHSVISATGLVAVVSLRYKSQYLH
jgi:hypothetical protein